MARTIYFASTIAGIALAFLFLFPGVSHAAFGISPPYINASHLVPGSTYTQTIYLVQDQPTQDLNVNANLQIQPPANSWVSIDKGFNFTIPAGVRQFPVTVTIAVPQNVTLGVFNGTLSFVTAPSSAGQVTIALGVQAAINLTVGSGTFEKYNIPLIQFEDIEEGQSPVVDVKFENDGNVAESFDSATYSLYDQYDSVQLAYAQKTNGFPTTPPFTVNDYKVTFPIGFYLGIGKYWGVVNFYKDGQVVASQKTVFNVLKATPFQEVLNFIVINWLVIALGLIVVIFAIIFLTRKGRRSAL